MSSSTTIDLPRCLACGRHDSLHRIYSAPDQPLANFMGRTAEEAVQAQRYPISLVQCRGCGHVQLASQGLSPALLFGSGYAYASGTSGTLKAYFRWLAERIARAVPTGNPVLDLACNDGSMMAAAGQAGLSPVGVEPDEVLAEQARWHGPVIQRFWPVGYATFEASFRMPGAKRPLTTLALNVLGHTPDPFGFLAGCVRVMRPGDALIVQTSQTDMLASGQFDCVYHEHYSYFSPESLRTLAERVGLEVVAQGIADVHGGSLVSIFQRPFSKAFDTGWRLAKALLDRNSGEPARISKILPEIPRFGSESDRHWSQAQAKIQDIHRTLESARAAARPLVFLGWAAKAAVVCHTVGVWPDIILDEAPAKIGRWVPAGPGRAVQIRPLEALADLPGRPLVVLSAWNFAEELARKARAVRPDRPFDLLTYFPGKIRVWQGSPGTRL